MSGESVVQVAPDSTGKKIRNLQLTVLQSDGTTAVVQMQVVSLADQDGNLLELGTADQLASLILIGQQQRYLLQMLVNHICNASISIQDLSNLSDSDR